MTDNEWSGLLIPAPNTKGYPEYIKKYIKIAQKQKEVEKKYVLNVVFIKKLKHTNVNVIMIKKNMCLYLNQKVIVKVIVKAIVKVSVKVIVIVKASSVRENPVVNNSI